LVFFFFFSPFGDGFVEWNILFLKILSKALEEAQFTEEKWY